ncbi:proline-rich transmembrane protein 1-like [Ptychodera flava]|uniref:proline-rich transmembrane protein 1-like n=1 Tax=Ptychodera flava TaxID=63121 RepID=UPI00396A8741
MSQEKSTLIGDGHSYQSSPYGTPPVYHTTTPPVQVQPGPGQPNVVHAHQHYAQQMNNPPNDYLVWSILACIFCFWPLGVAAIIKSLDVRRSVSMGDRERAERSSKYAKYLIVASVILGVILLTTLIVIVAV